MAPQKIDPVPSNIISFPSRLCRNAGRTGKLTARPPHPETTNIRQFPQRPPSSRDVTHGLFVETCEILTRCSGISPQWQFPAFISLYRPVSGE